jgi:hypothetical protein
MNKEKNANSKKEMRLSFRRKPTRMTGYFSSETLETRRK